MYMRSGLRIIIAAALVLSLAALSGVVRPILANTPEPDLDDGFVQVVHLAPFAEDARVTVTLNGAPILTEFDYGDSTEYLAVPAGEHLVEIIPTGTATVAISATIQIAEDTYYTAIAYGDGVNQDLGLMLLEDDRTPPGANQIKLRMGHLAPFAPGPATADVRLADGTPVLEDVDFADVTMFMPLAPGTYDLIITTPGGDTVLINPAPVTLEEGSVLSVFATGDGDNQDLGVFVLPPDVEGFFLPMAMGNVQIAHLAPFAEDARVTVAVNGEPVLTEFDYGDSTEYVPLPAGEHLVEIIPTGTATVAISATIEIAHDVYYTAIAYGDGVNQDLGLMLLIDDLTPPAPGQVHLRLGHLAPFASGLATADVRLADGTPVLLNVNFGDVSGFVPLVPGTYDLIITTPGGDTVLIDPLPVPLEEGAILSAFATGDGVNQPLGVYVLPLGTPGFFLPLRVISTYYFPIIAGGP